MTYIYALRCPESKDIRYVGKTKSLKDRLKSHIAMAKGFHTDHHCARWIRGLLNRGLRPEIFQVSVVSEGTRWQDAESEAIQAFRAAGHDLTNSTSGGDGFHDMDHECVSKRVATWKRMLQDPERRAKFIEATGYARRSPEVHALQSVGVSAAWQDPEKRSRFLAGMRTPEAKARRSAATKKRMTDPEGSAKHKAKMREMFSGAECREQIRQAGEQRWSRPGAKERASATMAVIMADPERKAKASEYSHRRWSAHRARLAQSAAENQHGR